MNRNAPEKIGGKSSQLRRTASAMWSSSTVTGDKRKDSSIVSGDKEGKEFLSGGFYLAYKV